jgi:hypothetical protein
VFVVWFLFFATSLTIVCDLFLPLLTPFSRQDTGTRLDGATIQEEKKINVEVSNKNILLGANITTSFIQMQMSTDKFSGHSLSG